MSQYPPEAPELLAAIAGVLDTVLPTAPAHLQHEVRVAANLARMVARELRAGPGEREPSDPTWDEMVAITRRDLAIAKPGYDQWDQG